MRTASASASVLCLVLFASFAVGPALAQDAGGAAASSVEELPAVEVVQDTPAKKAARAKKKAPAVSPLSSVSSAPPGVSTQTATGAPTAIPVAAPITVPSAVTNVTDTDIEHEGTGSIQQTLVQKVPGTFISDAAGNILRGELSFRGFDASPVSGRAQGLAIYQNGVRINEAFGDVVNWDAIPSNAISSMSVVSNNPSFGLNALGGAISILMKDGFSYQGGEVDLMAGSFGRKQVGIQAGEAFGNAGVYVAGEWFEDDGYRDFSESEVRRFYGDIGLKGTFAEVHFNLTAADNHFGATAAAPVELLARSWSNTFTSPQTTDVEVYMPSLSASVKATDTLTLSGVGYYRRFKNRVVDGNVTEIEPCPAPDDDELCLEDENVFDLNGDDIDSDIAPDDRLGSIERLATTSESWGGVVEGQEKAKLFGLSNLFLAGVSYDQGKSNYKTSSEMGVIQPKYVVTGTGVFVGGVEHDPDEGDELAPRNLNAENTYWGVYLSDALDVTDELTVTVGGRYNRATIQLTDLTGKFPDLNATNTYERFNPVIGANYKLLPGISVYGGYSESNRAPTPAELGCAEPENPCLIESFLTDDPPLKQVVGRTAELGLRGLGASYGGRYTWSAGLFRTLASDDILPIMENQRIFFVNAGDTLRQGLELSATYETRNWTGYASYAFLDATLNTCDDPSGECAFLVAGDRLPGIPRHLFKVGAEYALTSAWKVGADVIVSGDRPYFPNEAGGGDFLDAYTRVDLNTSYDVTKNIQLYGLVKNLFDQKYGLYGTYFESGEVSNVDKALGGAGFTDPRTFSPSMPFAAYGGVKVRY
ncbi:TonB-dependent receptor [Hyphomicrobium sp. xq]|uniref:TonB-dependent receptor n=1 Tax=Hyphomicrobium album TaxID=2665159 RepID=A0A6I3KJS4_9HYPH|nr:TonB-dependent receptor [Hyphomicrobium album]MTD94226.1 TonB-dependent receptor [Hyphomicrobium album]